MKTATDLNESKRLIALGIDPETADMHIEEWRSFDCKGNSMLIARKISDTERRQIKNDISHTEYTPAWSLSALLELMPKEMGIAVGAYPDSDKYTCFTLIDPDVEPTVADTPIAACIALIEQLVEQGYIETKKKEQ